MDSARRQDRSPDETRLVETILRALDTKAEGIATLAAAVRTDLGMIAGDDVMTRQPKTARPDQLVSEALELLNSMQKTQLIVVDAGKPVGVVHFHDLLRAGVA